MITRNILSGFVGAILSFVFFLAGSRLAYFLLVGRGQTSSNKDALLNLMLLQAFVVNPGMALIVGLFVGWLTGKSAWWLAGIMFEADSTQAR